MKDTDMTKAKFLEILTVIFLISTVVFVVLYAKTTGGAFLAVGVTSFSGAALGLIARDAILRRNARQSRREY
jgi:hypothetical protein